MNIVFVVSDFAPRVGGIATFNTDLAHGVSKHKDITHVLVLVLQGSETREEHISPSLTVRYLPRRGLLQIVKTLWKELRVIRSVDVLYSSNLFPVGFLTVLYGKYISHTPVIMTFHGTDILQIEGSGFTRWAKKWAVLHATVTTTVSNSTQALVSAFLRVPKERFPVIYYSLPTHVEKNIVSIRQQYGYSPDDVLVLTVSNLVKRKGTEDLVRAVASIADPNIKLLIVGDGPEKMHLQELVQTLGVGDRVRLYGRIPDVDSFYHHADIFVLASYFLPEEGDVEGLGIVFLEAQQHGVPVIGTRSGGIPEALVEGKTGFLVPERDVAALAEKIKLLAGDQALRARMGEAGKRFVAEKFGVEPIVEQCVAVYRRAVQPLVS